MAEFHILKYIPGSMKYRWTPYVTGGAAVFTFNPKAEYNGEWVALQPLGTEGQGLPQYPDRKKYSLIRWLHFGVVFQMRQLLLSIDLIAEILTIKVGLVGVYNYYHWYHDDDNGCGRAPPRQTHLQAALHAQRPP